MVEWYTRRLEEPGSSERAGSSPVLGIFICLVKYMAKKTKFFANFVLIAAVIILGGVLVYQNLSQPHNKVMPQDQLKAKIIDVIGKQIGGSKQVDVKKITKEGSLYKVNLTVMGHPYESYASLDGKYLFPKEISLNPPKPKTMPQAQKPEIDLFVMAYCPFGNQAEKLMLPVVNLLKDKADFQLHYIIYSDYASGYPKYCLNKANKYCSMHGVQEVHEDMRELCIQKYQKNKLWDFVKAMDDQTSPQNSDKKWEAIAQKLGIDVNKVKTCEKNEGTALLDQEIALTKKSYPVQDPSQYNNIDSITISGSPTIVINGMIYDGSRSTKAYQDAVCSAFKTAPAECNQKLDEPQQNQSQGGSCR